MRISLFILGFLLHSLLSLSQEQLEDSLKIVLKHTAINRQNLKGYLARLTELNPTDSVARKTLFNWIELHSTADSLDDIAADANLQMGRHYAINTQFGEAAGYLTKAQAIAEKKGLNIILAQTLNVLGYIYDKNDVEGKAEQYYRESIKISKENNLLPEICKAKYNLGKLLFEQSLEKKADYRSGLGEMLEAFRLAVSIKDTNSIINQGNGLSDSYARLGKHDSAIYYLNNSVMLFQDKPNEATLLNLYANLGGNHKLQQQYTQALSYYNKGLVLAEEYSAPRWLCTFYYGLAETYELMGDYRKANHYNLLNIKMHNDLVKSENFVAAADIQNRYENTKKNNKILILEVKNKKKSIINTITVSIIVGLMLVSLLFYTNYRKSVLLAKQQQDLQQQKMMELEKDRQLVAIDAMLKGQEEERSRVAKELHDGLGGLLSGAKYSLTDLKEKIALSGDNSVRFDRSLELLNTSIDDLRRLAHNLMPGALSKFGLIEALRDFCDSIHNSTGIEVMYQHYGLEREPESTPAIFIYRIVQELVNNAVKYALATTIVVEIMIHENKIDITVEDNGIGFDKQLVKAQKGAGIKNVQLRVEYLTGTFDIDTAPGNGTSAYIQVFV